MGLFYKYKCRNCGKKYTYLPINCRSCGTELSFICTMDRWSMQPEYKQTKECEVIFEFPFFGKKARIRELESQIRRMKREISRMQEEMDELTSDKIDLEKKLDANRHLVISLRGQVNELNHYNEECKRILYQYRRREEKNANRSIPQDTISAVRYAMKHAHPDNGGNTEEFVGFKKCYEELVGR